MRRHEIESKLAKLEEERRSLQKALDESKSRTLIECTSNCYGQGCGAKMTIGSVIFIQTWWHVPPSGCTEGDYWLPSEGGEFDCAKCGHRNRLWDRKEFDALKYQFKGIVDTYDENGRPPKVDYAKVKMNNI